ncbi:Mus7/MMS22 family-domain-containing protein [Mycena crocata]|nr:Mus7/MMS22 family-domain-containing protein [Mycena crocata]
MDEVVETSDPEELEELRIAQQNSLRSSQTRSSQTAGPSSPRKRPKLHHEYTDIALRTPARSRSSSSEAPSRFHSASEHTSPASLTEASSPKASSPVATPPISVTDSSISPVQFAWGSELGDLEVMAESQDPLQLQVGGNTNPKFREDEATSSNNRYSSPPLDDNDPMGAGPPHPSTPSRSQRSRSGSVDPLLLFTPSRPSLRDTSPGASTSVQTAADADPRASPPKQLTAPSSPLTPPPPDRPVNHSRKSPQRSPSPPDHPDDLAVAQALADNPGRYSLRERKAKQLNPYKHDKAEYQITLRHHPEAIVKFRSPRRHQREEDYEQTQEPDAQGYEAENDENENEEERRGRKHPKNRSNSHKENPAWFKEFLPAMSDTDEEDGKEVDVTKKEGRKFRREQRKREVLEKHGRKLARPFPLKELNDNDVSQRPSRHATRSNSPDSQMPMARRFAHKSPSRSQERTPKSPNFPAIFQAPNQHPPSPVFQPSHSPSPPVFDGDDDMEMQAYDFPLSPIERNDPGTPFVISDGDNDHAADKNIEESDDSAAEPESRAERKRRRELRALNRVYPAFMRAQVMIASAPAKKQHRSATVPSEGEEEQPLLPGQTRKARKAERPRDLREIKGDTESSDDQRVSSGDDLRVVERPDEPVVWGSSDEEILADGRIDDEQIEAYLQEADLRATGLQEKDMIDWMLDNNAEVGGTRKPRKPSTRVKSAKKYSHSEGTRRPKISITIGGARRERQTLLSFNKPGQSRDRRATTPSDDDGRPNPVAPERRKPAVYQTRLVFDVPHVEIASQSRRRRDHSPYSGPERELDDAPPFRHRSSPSLPPPFPEHLNGNVHVMPDQNLLRKAVRKQKEKDRRARMKMNGVHIFVAPKGRRIMGQHGKHLNINVTDDGFHRALAPVKSKEHHPSKNPPKPKIASVKSQTGSAGVRVKRRLLTRSGGPRIPAPPAGMETAIRAESDDDGYPSYDEIPPDKPQIAKSPEAEERPPVIDFAISVLPPGITFPSGTYTRKGWLSELVNGPVPVGRPEELFFSAHGFDLGPRILIPQFLTILSNICDRLFEFATGLPEDDDGQQAKEWAGLIRVTCQLVTWLRAGDEAQTMKNAVEKQVFQLTSKMRDAALSSASMDSTTFVLCWFAVELSIRSGFTLPASAASRSPDPNVLQEACNLLIEYLLEYGLERGMEPLVAPQDGMDGSTTQRAFEAWVGIWHIADKYKHSTSAHNPVWKIVQNGLTNRQSAQISPFGSSENAWRAIFSLTAMAQFSVMGASRSLPSFPACWDMVQFALERIRSEASAELEKSVPDSSLNGVHRYLHLVTERCCLLWSRWNWTLDSTFSVLSTLSNIFRSRKFANLRQDKAEFPDFLRLNDWSWLSRRIHTETTFVLFLKLVYQSLLVDKSKIKKLLSVATPVGSLPWSKAQPPSLQDLSMLFNRLSVIAIAIHVDPENHARWIQRARGYVKFKDVDATTRNAYIRGLMYLSIVMVQRDLPLDEPLKWLDEMVSALLDEHKHQPGRIVVLGIHALVVSVRNIIRSFKGDNTPESRHRYPDPRLLLSLERILRDLTLVKPNNGFAHIVPRLIRSFFTARSSAVPPPRRPSFRPVVPDPESQDEYGELVFDPDLIAALDQESRNAEAEYEAKDRSLCKLFGEHISWILLRQLVQYLGLKTLKAGFKANDRVSTDIARLTACWLGCGNIIIQSSGKLWSDYLHPYIARPMSDDFCHRRMEFLVYSNVLKLDPMTYVTFQDKFFVVLFESLASWHTTSEDDYIKLFLAIDGSQHPLLRGAWWNPPAIKDGTSKLDVLTARLPLITTILENLSQSLIEAVNDEDNKRYVGYCITMFSAMKNTHSVGFPFIFPWTRSKFVAGVDPGGAAVIHVLVLGSVPSLPKAS